MIVLEDIRSLSDFMRNAKTSLRRLQKSGRPEVLTVNGRAGVVVQDAAAYQKLMEELEDARTRESIRQAERGEVMPAKEAFVLLRRRAAERRKKMSYPFELTTQARADMELVHERISAHSAEAADRVYELLEKSFESLADFPNRHPRARESAHESIEIRQYMVGNYRVLFTVLPHVVQILRVRHAAQKDFGPGELN